MMEWSDQVAVVTGGNRGLGRATAWLLAQRGAAVCVNYAAHGDAAEALIAAIAAAGGRAIAVAASERLTGDFLWLLLISGPGAAKTETVQALAGAGAHVTSTIASEGALLSATSRKQRSKTATGGLLRKIGDRGVLVIKDVTSILSAARETRGCVLAAIREIYDGRWERNVGPDGGQMIFGMDSPVGPMVARM
jgi:hypothetical protein